MKIAWLGLLAFGFAGVLATSACEVTTGGAGGVGDDEGGRRNSGGTGGTTGGKASGGTSTGGTTGGSGTGGKASGGSTTGGSATGGSEAGGEGFDPMCDDPDHPDPGFPATSCDVPEVGSDENVACIKCLKDNRSCCDALKKCYATGPDNECGYGGKELLQTEYLCFQDCILEKIMENGTYTGDDQDTCSIDCSPSCGLPSDATNDVVTCMHDKCETECFPQ